MSYITINIPFCDRNIWIKRIDQRIAESDGKALAFYDSELKRYNEYSWWVRWFILKPPSRDWTMRDSLSGISTLKILKDMLETSGWETMSIDGWIFKWLKGCDE